MALIDPKGLLYGERLGDCSDDAQLHWPRLFCASNGYGRIELSLERLTKHVYGSFKAKPDPVSLARWFEEYQKNSLLFIYQAQDGSLWGQWITSEKYLPRHKTTADEKSPAPNFDALEAYKKEYIDSRKSKYLSIQSFHKSSEHLGAFLLGGGVGEGIGEGIKTPPSRAQEPEPFQPKTLEGEPPPGLPVLQYSRGMLEMLCVPVVMATQQAAAAGIESFARERGLPFHLATSELTKLARDALARGEAVNKWWFTDRKWAQKGGSENGRKETRNSRILRESLVGEDQACEDG